MINVVRLHQPTPETGDASQQTPAATPARARPSEEVLLLARCRINQAMLLLGHALNSARELESRLSDPATRRQFGDQVATIEESLQSAARRMQQI